MSCLGHADEGSGTLAGVALMALASLMMSIIVCVGAVFIGQSQVRSAADLAAIAAAQSLADGDDDPCAAARMVAGRNHAGLRSCAFDGEDATVKVAARAPVPFIDQLSAQATAGPIACE